MCRRHSSRQSGWRTYCLRRESVDLLLPGRSGRYRRYEPINVGRDELGERLARGVERLREREVAPRVPGVFVERLCECKCEGEAVSWVIHSRLIRCEERAEDGGTWEGGGGR